MTGLSQGAKAFVGALTLWPVIYIFIFISIAFAVPFLGARRYSEGMPAAFAVLMVAHLFTMALMLALVAFYIVFLFRTSRVAADKKALWAVVLFLGNVFSMPIFFWLYVWPKEEGVGLQS